MAGERDEKSVFERALNLPAEQREAYLNEVCPDPFFRKRIESLLRHHAEAGAGFLGEETSQVTYWPARIAEFRILEPIGDGGMGIVYKAEDTVLGRTVAIKLLAPHLTGSEQALARFREEARSAARLHHPAIVQVFKFGEEAGIHYIVSEFVNGPTLARLIEQHRTSLQTQSTQEDARSWYRRCAEIIAPIADALECAHRAKLVHRDVKPSNILMDPELGPRLTDFGIAKYLVDEHRTAPTDVLGSCHYMSPEQASIAGSSIDQRSDVFSLGVVLYEMLSLRRPFEGETASQVLTALAACQPPRLRSCDRRIPKDLETICHKAMEKERERRYQTAAHVAAELRCFLNNVPIITQPPSVARRAYQLAIIHRRRLAVASVILLAGTVTMLLWLVQSMRSESLAWFRIDGAENGWETYLQTLDPRTLQLGSAVFLGSTPQRIQTVPKGVYRLTVVQGDSAFSELDLVLDEQGRAKMTTIDFAPKHAASGSPAQNAADSRILSARMVPTTSVDPEMIFIPAGEYHFGWSEDEKILIRKRSVTLSSFLMDRTEVSNEDYKAFCDTTGHKPPEEWKIYGYDSVSPKAPVVTITWQDAQDYAVWVGKRLPTMYEWQAAARGKEGRNRCFNETDAQLEESMCSLKDLYALGSSDTRVVHETIQRLAQAVEQGRADAAGFLHMGSNAKEFSSTVDFEDKAAVILGPCWSDFPEDRDLAKVWTAALSISSFKLGFRCAKSASPVRPRQPLLKGEKHAVQSAQP